MRKLTAKDTIQNTNQNQKLQAASGTKFKRQFIELAVGKSSNTLIPSLTALYKHTT